MRRTILSFPSRFIEYHIFIYNSTCIWKYHLLLLLLLIIKLIIIYVTTDLYNQISNIFNYMLFINKLFADQVRYDKWRCGLLQVVQHLFPWQHLHLWHVLREYLQPQHSGEWNIEFSVQLKCQNLAYYKFTLHMLLIAYKLYCRILWRISFFLERIDVLVSWHATC